MRFRLLGPVEAWDGGRRVEIGHARQRSVLAALLYDAGTALPTTTLIDRVWGHQPPDGALNVLYTYVARLRRALRVPLVSRSGAYLLDIDPESVDLHRFRRLLAGAGADVAALDEALGLWRGSALSDLNGAWAAEVRATLTAQLLSAHVLRNDAYLRDGRHAELVGPLHELLAAHPGEERLVGQLMLALYRSNRVAEAHEQYRLAHRQLAQRQGRPPGPYLRELHQRMLRDDPTLIQATQPDQALPVPAGLPLAPPGFVARRAELAAMDRLLPLAAARRAVVISAVDGGAGVGKTALALHWAHRAKSRFPGGHLYANLHGYGQGTPADPSRVLTGFLAALDVAPQKIPADLDARAALYRSMLDGRSLLLVLDNAATAEQVRPLLPGSPGCLVVVTSRSRLTGLIAVDGARPLTLGLMTDAEAGELLASRLGVDRLAAEPQAVAEVVASCARLPLALTLVAARAAAHPHFPLHAMAAELRDSRDRLDVLAGADPASDLRALFSWSCRTLSAAAAQLFRLLSVHPGPDISAAAAAALGGLTPRRVRPVLAELARAHLVVERSPARYDFHDLLRAFAAEQLRATEPGRLRVAALHRMLDHYVHTAHAADRLLDPVRELVSPAPAVPGAAPAAVADHEQALAWFGAEHAVLLHCLQVAVDNGLDCGAWQLAWALNAYLDRQGHWQDWAVTQTLALAAADRLADPATQARSHRYLAFAYARLSRFDDAQAHLRHALELHRQAGDLMGQGRAQISLAFVHEQQGRHRDALQHAQQALRLHRAAGHQIGQADALNAIGWLHTQLDDHAAALLACEQALSLYRELGDLHGQADSLDSIGHAHHRLGEHQQAIARYRHALQLYRDIGARYWEATILSHLGDAHAAAAGPGPARDCWRQALRILTELDHPDAEQVRTKLPGGR